MIPDLVGAIAADTSIAALVIAARGPACASGAGCIILRAVRLHFGDIPLMVDANASLRSVKALEPEVPSAIERGP